MSETAVICPECKQALNTVVCVSVNFMGVLSDACVDYDHPVLEDEIFVCPACGVPLEIDDNNVVVSAYNNSSLHQALSAVIDLA